MLSGHRCVVRGGLLTATTFPEIVQHVQRFFLFSLLCPRVVTSALIKTRDGANDLDLALSRFFCLRRLPWMFFRPRLPWQTIVAMCF
jgi:hypothetical protein